MATMRPIRIAVRSLESALLDAWTQISLGDIDTALVGWFDEQSALQAEDRALSLVLTADPAGTLYELERPALCGN